MKPLPLYLALLGLLGSCAAQAFARNETGCGELNAVCCQLQINREQAGCKRLAPPPPAAPAPAAAAAAAACSTPGSSAPPNILLPSPPLLAADVIQDVCNTKELYCNYDGSASRCVPVPAVRQAASPVAYPA